MRCPSRDRTKQHDWWRLGRTQSCFWRVVRLVKHSVSGASVRPNMAPCFYRLFIAIFKKKSFMRTPFRGHWWTGSGCTGVGTTHSQEKKGSGRACKGCHTGGSSTFGSWKNMPRWEYLSSLMHNMCSKKKKLNQYGDRSYFQVMAKRYSSSHYRHTFSFCSSKTRQFSWEKIVNVKASWCVLIIIFKPWDWEGNLKI